MYYEQMLIIYSSYLKRVDLASLVLKSIQNNSYNESDYIAELQDYISEIMKTKFQESKVIASCKLQLFKGKNECKESCVQVLLTLEGHGKMGLDYGVERK